MAAAIPKAMVQGISQHLRNQRPDEIPNLFAYAQLLLSINQTEGRYGTTHTAAKFWAKWRREFDDAHLQAIKNAPLRPDVRAALFERQAASLATYFDTLWSAPMQATEQDKFAGESADAVPPVGVPARLRALRPQGRQDRRSLSAVLRYPRTAVAHQPEEA